MKTRIAIAVSGALFLVAASAGAADQIKESIHPVVNGSPVTLMKDNLITQKLGGRLVNLDVWAGEFIKYDDNIFGAKHKKESDTIFSTAAGFVLQAQDKGIWTLDMQAQYQYNKYADNSAFNGSEGFFRTKGSYEFSPALQGRFNLGYARDYDNVRNERAIYNLDTFNAGVGATVRPTPFHEIALDYAFAGQRRENGHLSYQEFDEHTVSMRPSFALTPNITVYGQAAASKIDSKGDWYNDTDAYTFGLGGVWQYRDTAKVTAEVGVKHMSFDDNGRIGDTKGSVTRPTLRLAGELAIDADWKIGADMTYGPSVGALTTNARNSSYIDQFRLAGLVQYSPGAGRFTARMTPFYTRTNPSEDVNYSEYGMGIGVTYSVREWLSTSFGYRFSIVDYSDQGSYSHNAVTLGAALTF